MNFKTLKKKRDVYVGLEVFNAPKYSTLVSLRSDEVTAICPITSQPDWYVVELRYAPNKKCIESKSFKLFMHSLRDRGMFCESLSDHILKECQAVLQSLDISVTVTQKSRGGVTITATSAVKKGS